MMVGVSTKMSMRVSVCLMLILGMICSGITGVTSQAAKKAKLKTKKISMVVGQKKKITISGKQKKAVYSFSSSSKAKAAVSKSGVVTAKKAGKVTVTVKEKYKKKTRKLGKVTVQIKAKKVTTVQTPPPAVPSASPSAVPSVAPSAAPVSSAPAATEPAPTEEPEPTIKPITSYVEDTEVDVPTGFMDQDNGVAGTVEDITYESTVVKEGATVMRKAKVILPKDYSDSKKYPVVYMQHGIGGNETSLFGDKVQYVVWNAIANGDAEEMIVVLPNACANEKGSGAGLEFHSPEQYAAYDNFINDLKECLIPYINDNYSTMTGRENTAVCGFSMGGRVSLHVGFMLQDMFRYVGAFCPAPGILEHTTNNVHEDGLFTPETFTLKQEYMDDTLVLIAAGKNDGVVGKNPKNYADTLEANGVPHIYYETMGGDENHKGGGGHEANVYKHGLYNFLRRIFHLYD